MSILDLIAYVGIFLPITIFLILVWLRKTNPNNKFLNFFMNMSFRKKLITILLFDVMLSVSAIYFIFNVIHFILNN